MRMAHFHTDLHTLLIIPLKSCVFNKHNTRDIILTGSPFVKNYSSFSGH